MVSTSKINDLPPQWRELYKIMEDKLAEIELGTEDRTTKLKLSINVCRSAVESLRMHVNSYIFQSSEDEIYFFKEVKPAFYSQLIYYLKMFHLETGRPPENSKLWEPNLIRFIERLQYFFDNNLEFYQYYRSGETYLDAKYFKRDNQESYLKVDDYYFSYDTSFSTSHDVKVAKILANERLYLYASKCLSQLNSLEDEKPESLVASEINWTATKAGLIELLYALQSAGVFNNGATDLKQLAQYLERTFNIELGNYYNVFQEIRLRKKNRTSFLDQLKDKLSKRMDEADDNGR